MADVTNGQISCLECGEKIPADARLCRYCKTPQNWSRFLFRWKDIIVAVLALAPLWGGAYALILPMFEEDTPRLKILDASCESDKPIFLLSNRGNAPAIVKTIGLPFTHEEISLPYEYILRPETVEASKEWIELPPKTTTPMRFALTTKGTNVPLPKNRPGESRIVVIEYIDLGGSKYHEASNWPCGVEP